ncbi:MAG TPA: serine/threonine-protein kinase [Gemmataceae bacterium]|nr:serine/threonine-protein kinase [Gemmataceae bacterium]
MPLLLKMSSLALKHVLQGACTVVGLRPGPQSGEGVVAFLTQRFTDHSQRLPLALQKANDSAWKAIEVALAGESLWSWLAKSDQKAFREQVRAFLDATPLANLPGHGPDFRTTCLKELRAARKAGRLLEGSLDPAALAREAGHFARFGDPESLLAAEWQAVDGMALELREYGYPTLAQLVALRGDPPGSVPVLIAGVRFFFRREVETDRELYQGLTWAKLEAIQEATDKGFASLADALTTQGQRLEELLGTVQEYVIETHGAVLDVQAEQHRQGQQLQEMYQAVWEMKKRHDLQASEVRPRDSLAIGSDSERRLVRGVLERFRALPADQQRQLPALLNSLGQLEVATGEFEAAQKVFQEVAGLVSDRAAQAEAFHNAYGAALEKGDHEAALAALKQAAALEPARFSPFPLHKYEPERILGAGGFGVAFLCRNRHVGNRLVIKTLRADTLELQVSDVFREARVLEDLEHPAIIRLRDCDFADAAGKRPYLVMDYFEGLTLQNYVEKHGAIPPEQLVALARPVAEALREAHTRAILHRDVKPANLLVRQEGSGWRVKLIDFGLALKQQVLTTTMASADVRARTVTGYSVAGTLDYAAPEQMGKLPGVAVSPATDIYGFGKTCCYALFKTTQPLRKHWKSVPEELADLLEQCLHETPAERIQTFDALLEGLAAFGKPAAPPKVERPPVTPAPVKPVAEHPRERWWASASSAGELACFEGHSDGVLAVAFAPGGKEIISGGGDGTVRLWETETGRERCCMLGHRDKVWAVVAMPDGRRALSAGKDKAVRLWDLASGRESRCLEGRTNRTVALAPDGTLAISGSLSDGMVRLWQTDSAGREVRRFKGHMSWVLAAAFSPDGTQALTGSADGTVRLWEVESGRELRRMQGHKDQVLSVAFAPTGRLALSGSADRSVRFWDLRSGKQVRAVEGVSDQVWSVAFSPDGRYALWEAAEASPTGPAERWELLLWDVEHGREVQRFAGHSAKIMSVAFSPDGRCALSGSMDSTMRLWKLPG